MTKNTQLATNPAVYSGFMFLLLFLIAGTSEQTARAQTWSPPSFVVNEAVGECYDDIAERNEDIEEIHRETRDAGIKLANDGQQEVLGLLGAGTTIGATAATAIAGPWSLVVVLAGGVKGTDVYNFFEGQRELFRQDYKNRMKAANDFAEQEALICENTHVNGGDPENETDEPELQNSGSIGINVVGGSQTTGNRGRVTGYLVNY